MNKKNFVETTIVKETTTIACIDVETNQKFKLVNDEIGSPEMDFANVDEDKMAEAWLFFGFENYFVHAFKSTNFETSSDGIKFCCFKDIRKAIEFASSKVQEEAGERLAEMEAWLLSRLFSDGCPYGLTAYETENNLIGILQTDAKSVLSCENQKELLDHLTSVKEDKKPSLDSAYYMFTSLEDVNKHFEKLAKAHKAKRKNGTALMVAHNASYEWNMLFRKLPFFQKAVKENRLTALRGNSSNAIKSVTIWEKPVVKANDEFGNHKLVEIRDTFLYKRSSLAKIGKQFGFPKDNLDYEVFFNPELVQLTITKRIKGKAPENQYNHLLDYNRIDCTIPFLIVYESIARDYEILTADMGDKEGSFPISANHIQSTLQREHCRAVWAHYEKDKETTFNNVPYITKQKKTGRSLTEKWEDACKWSKLNEETFDKVHAVAGGGMVGINPFVAGKIIDLRNSPDEVIFHIDLISAHPSQVFKRYFPEGLPFEANAEQKNYVVKVLNVEKGLRHIVDKPVKPFQLLAPILGRELNACKDEEAKAVKSGYYSGFGKFRLKNVRIKTWYNHGYKCCIPAMPFVKIRRETSGNSLDGVTVRDAIHASRDGKDILKEAVLNSKASKDLIEQKNLVISNKIYNMEETIVTCTIEDLLCFTMFYDFEIADVDGLNLYHMEACPEFLYYVFRMYAEKKETYKALTKMQERGESVSAIVTFLEKNKGIFLESDYNYLHGNPLDLKFAKQALTQIKGIFNGIYGQNYQSNIHTSCGYGVLDDLITEVNVSKDYKASSKRNYLVSMYIAQWSKVDLALHIGYIARKGACPLYWATDSIYYIDNVKNPAIPKKDGKLVKLFNSQSGEMKLYRSHSKVAPLGGMDLEEDDIQRFCTTQALRNLYECTCKKEKEIDGKKVKVSFVASKLTFSGCNEDILFVNCESSADSDFYDFDKTAKIFTSENYYVSPLKNRKQSKNVAEDGTYCLVPQAFVLNSLDNLDYLAKKLLAQ